MASIARIKFFPRQKNYRITYLCPIRKRAKYLVSLILFSFVDPSLIAVTQKVERLKAKNLTIARNIESFPVTIQHFRKFPIFSGIITPVQVDRNHSRQSKTILDITKPFAGIPPKSLSVASTSLPATPHLQLPVFSNHIIPEPIYTTLP